ncbi:MAG TPA: alpha/beta fold hydrolase, partial [Tepidisphaeraceae bacterium]|nr:alpha/beta fold hydrolase [Tepidisphaeraceae bacterium]
MPTLPSESPTTQIVRSADDIRTWIVGEVARSLNVDPATIDTAAPLHSLGVDSLGAIGMTGGLAGWLNRDLPASLMWDYASIDAMAEGLADRDTAPPRVGIVDFQSRGNLTPVFFFPGLGGHPVTFAAMAAELGPTQPCYGLTVPGLNGEQKPLTRVEEIAAAMLENLRLVQPKGPYQLAGYSFGGLLAYETARQLEAMGETVSMLAIYDAFTPAGRKSRPAWQRFALHVYSLIAKPNRVQYLRDRVNRRRALAEAEIASADDPPNITAAMRVANPKDVGKVNSRAAASYRPGPYSGSVLVFRATDRPMHNIFYKIDPSNGWGASAAGGVNVIDLPGSHLSLL